ncbi:MAG: DNA-binding response OmpR family regulator [Alteromonadaceae bacterium]
MNIYFNAEKENGIKHKLRIETPNLEFGGNETVLIVEDDDMLLDIQMLTLERFGYKVLSASTCSFAQMIAQDNVGKIDLLLTDVILPEMNGKELAEKISAFCPEMHVLFMSGHTADIIANKGIICNDSNFIQKPFNSKALVSKVREVLSAKVT